MRTAVIMQPTYLPWTGYFDLMDQADVFVLLDSVQFEKRSWQQRNRVKGPNGVQWLTVPVRSKGRVEQRIQDVEIDETAGFARRHLESFRHLYGRAPHYARYAEALDGILLAGHARLADLNADVIAWGREVLGIGAELVRSSTLDVSGKRADLLVTICRAVGADRYLSPVGSRGYLEESDAFTVAGIELAYHDYVPAPYAQLYGDFVPYLSIADLIFNAGPASGDVVRAGRQTGSA